MANNKSAKKRILQTALRETDTTEQE